MKIVVESSMPPRLHQLSLILVKLERRGVGRCRPPSRLSTPGSSASGAGRVGRCLESSSALGRSCGDG